MYVVDRYMYVPVNHVIYACSQNIKARTKQKQQQNVNAKTNNGSLHSQFLQLHSQLGRVWYLASKLDLAYSPTEAELKAIEWAFELAVEKNWSKIIWSSDALNVVKEILSSSNPSLWEIRYSVLYCRSLLRQNEWKMEWNARSSNVVADCVAKVSLNSNTVLSTYDQASGGLL
ncbi:hypothetical protein FNV43_RR23553 [Rhamnella rubrinervis]|uniref:RNase H type-1 domain-containing protein n=1 Tax=Rhamnella rubrinervis TaxID=2594499 RepID=A0A8K0DTJ9_9ROSA|nr:hypothetical protein FNV43_RR23553 [Rhamnella rubrinervis]